jgi:excinuclease UvrABC ATPase subunit
LLARRLNERLEFRLQTATPSCFFQCKQGQQVSFSFNHRVGAVPACEIGSKALWDVHTLRFESMRPIVPHLPKFESKFYDICERFDFKNYGPWGRIFLAKHTKKNTVLSKKYAPKPAKDDM